MDPAQAFWDTSIHLGGRKMFWMSQDQLVEAVEEGPSEDSLHAQPSYLIHP